MPQQKTEPKKKNKTEFLRIRTDEPFLQELDEYLDRVRASGREIDVSKFVREAIREKIRAGAEVPPIPSSREKKSGKTHHRN